MRIRSIKPEWLDDERLALASGDARTLSVALILLADDYGNGRCHLTMLGARVFPGNPTAVGAALDELDGWYLERYAVDGQQYYHLRSWEKHQRVDKPGPCKVPGPEEALSWEETPVPVPLANIPEPVANVRESSRVPRALRDQEGKGSGGERSRARATIADPPGEDVVYTGRDPHDVVGPVNVAYQRHFEDKLNEPWMSAAEARSAATTVGMWAVEQARRRGEDVDELLDRLMTGYFADNSKRRRRWPMKWLAEDPGRYLESAQSATSEETMAVVKELIRQRREASEAGNDTRHAELDAQIKRLTGGTSAAVG